MMLAHIGGLPFEEWLGPVLVSGGSIAVALRAALRLGTSRKSRSG